jgi:hypothetical protein
VKRNGRADNPGPTATRLEGEQLWVRYEELDSNDVCEIAEARLSLAQRRVTVQARRQGSYEKRQCVRQLAADPLPAGDGTADRPLLTLHR